MLIFHLVKSGRAEHTTIKCGGQAAVGGIPGLSRQALRSEEKCLSADDTMARIKGADFPVVFNQFDLFNLWIEAKTFPGFRTIAVGGTHPGQSMGKTKLQNHFLVMIITNNRAFWHHSILSLSTQ